MSRWRPSPDEERWLEVASELGAAVPRSALTERTGGWRSTGPLARIALFVLGIVAALLLVAILGFRSQITLLIAGLIATLAAEWLTVRKRLHASGIEEGLNVAGFLLIGAWITTFIELRLDFASYALVLIIAVGAAGLRRLNPFVTTCAVLALVPWVGWIAAPRVLDPAIGADATAFTFGCALAALALVLGAQDYRRPSHDRMLDWLVATLPVAAYAQQTSWIVVDASSVSGISGTNRLAIVVLLLVLGATMLIVGLRRRRRAPLWGFMGCVAGLAVELRAAVPLAAETWLIGCGLVALVVGVTLERYLRQPRNGLTSASLAHREGPLDLLQIAGTALLAQRAAPELRPAQPTFEGGGGRFGGGGAGGEY